MTHYAAFFRSVSPISAEFWCVAGVCAGIFLFIQGFRLLQRRHLILDTPFSKIRSAAMGMVEVSGLAVGPYTMIAPVSGHPCYYYRTLVWEWKRQDKRSEWVRVAAECMHLPFFIDDNTGRVLVDPRGAELDIHRDFIEEFSDSLFTSKDPAPPNIRAFLGRHGVETENKIKVEEYCIKPKNSLFILGSLADNPGLEVTAQPVTEIESVATMSQGGLLALTNSSLSSLSPTLSSSSASVSFSVGRGDNLDTMLFEHRARSQPGTNREIIRLTPETAPSNTGEMTQQQKIAAALVKAGISNPAAWAAAGLSAPATAVTPDPVFGKSPDNLPHATHALVGAESTQAAVPGSSGSVSASPAPDATVTLSAADQHPPVVLMKGVNNSAFMISWRSQQAIAGSLRWKSVLMIWGGPVLALASLYALLNSLDLL